MFPQVRSRAKLSITVLFGALVLAAGGAAAAGTRSGHAGPQGDGTAVTTNGWTVTPAARQVQLGERPYGSALSPDGRTLLVSNDGQWKQSLQVVDTGTGAVRQTIPYLTPEALWVGVAFSPNGRHAYASAGGNNKIRVYDVDGQRLAEGPSVAVPPGLASPNPHPGGIAVSPDGKTLYAADDMADAVTVVDLTAGHPVATVPVGHNPYTVALDRAGRHAFVSDWGADTLSVLDTATNQVVKTIRVGTHPSALRLSPAGDRLFLRHAAGLRAAGRGARPRR